MASGGKRRGGTSPGAGRGVSRAEPPSLWSLLLYRTARGRRWGRTAPRITELPRRRSLPHRAPRCLTAARRAGRAAGQSGRLPTRPRPSRVAGLRVGRGPGRRRGAPKKGLGCADNMGGPGCRLGLGADSRVPGPRGRLRRGFLMSQRLSFHLVGGVRVP